MEIAARFARCPGLLPGGAVHVTYRVPIHSDDALLSVCYGCGDIDLCWWADRKGNQIDSEGGESLMDVLGSYFR